MYLNTYIYIPFYQYFPSLPSRLRMGGALWPEGANLVELLRLFRLNLQPMYMLVERSGFMDGTIKPNR